MKNTLLASVSFLLLIAGSAVADQQEFPAKLAGQAILPANTVVAAPADAPEFLKHSGKFTTADRKRTEALGSVPGKDGARVTDLKLPFDGQAVQGFSGIKTMPDGTFWTLSDNGFGSKANSSDAMLFLHQVKFDWQTGKLEVIKNLFLSDPDKKAPFPIVLEGAEKRYLTGADFDIESVQPVADGFWLGEEFGPYLLKFDTEGRLTDVISTKVDGKPVMSPDNPTLSVPANPTAKMPVFNLKRSGGFEGLAMSKDGSKLYGLLEGALYQDDGKMESVDGHPKQPKPDCFEAPAELKRIYKIEFNDANVGKAVRKIGYIDLLNIKDPDNKKKAGSKDGVYDMPFVTIENVDRVDATQIVVGNDNNLPFSAGRAVDKADNNEFSLLEVGELLNAK
ncbi:glycerophosphodiester phosphodiesterase [Rhizobium sp. R72]|uniref:esterase-like activity of phytase family protein n=1 Tax=unclassified Rhizobium TaxID=2613769 RepID=UPI000B531659|nr:MULTISPECIES: esterase-like activity of phytase family protein [unclassified Rhizobium]OWW03623.1 glycerophosphodiester phosphodiesterase [Rhizobium sp. R72]OWW03830.1 glycerophosphodiester phosphodiesterase [Rhizobium sp. R711]